MEVTMHRPDTAPSSAQILFFPITPAAPAQVPGIDAALARRRAMAVIATDTGATANARCSATAELIETALNSAQATLWSGYAQKLLRQYGIDPDFAETLDLEDGDTTAPDGAA
jgi:hypothetical protein